MCDGKSIEKIVLLKHLHLVDWDEFSIVISVETSYHIIHIDIILYIQKCWPPVILAKSLETRRYVWPVWSRAHIFNQSCVNQNSSC